MKRTSIEQKFRITTIDGVFEDFYPFNLEEVERLARESSPAGYVISVEPLAIVSVPRRYLGRHA